MRSAFAARAMLALVLLSLVLGSSLNIPSVQVFAQDASPPSESQQSDGPAVQDSEELPTKTAIPDLPTETNIPEIPTEVLTSEPTDVPVQPADDVTLMANTVTCFLLSGQWQIFVTMDAFQFPATATLNFASGATATVTYQQSSFINGRAYGDFEWFSNLSDTLVSITGAFPANLNPSLYSVAGPTCGTPTAIATATHTETPIPTETATPTMTATTTVANVTLMRDAETPCYGPANFWQIFITMDDYRFPATATVLFASGATITVSYQQSSFINGRAYGLYEWSGYLSESFSSISGAFPANLNPRVQSVTGPSCEPVSTAIATGTTVASNTPTATETSTATASNTATATLTATSTSTPMPVIVTSASVHCRVGPSTSATSLGVVAKGTSIPVRGAMQGGWTPVICFGQDGWISSSYAPTATATSTPTLIPLQGLAFMQSTTNCFASPSLSSTVIGSVSANARIPLRGGLQNGWYPVVCFGQDGWVLGSYVAVQTATPTRTATVTSTPVATVVTTASVNCRISPSGSATILGVVAKGTTLGARGATQNGWTPVTCFGQDGWISTSYLPTVTPTHTATLTPSQTPSRTPTRTATVTPTFIPVTGSARLQSNTNCFAQPFMSSTVVGTINRNAVIPLLGGLQNGWYPVVCNGQTAWILGSYIAVVTATPTATSTATLPSSGSVVTTARVNCRSAANTTASIITVVASGATLPLRGATVNDWTPVTCGGQAGWISSRYLR